MGTVIILSEERVNELKFKGFKYKRIKNEGGDTYEFIATPALMEYLNKHFCSKDYCVRKTINY